jgi:hypothetical protein
MTDTELWERLGLSPGAYTDEQLKEAYLLRARTAHPDAGGSDAAFVALQDAYEQLLASSAVRAADQPAGWWARTVWAWRGWARWRRLAAVLAVALAAGTVLVRWYALPGVAPGARAAVAVYAAGWLTWWLGRELRRPPVRPRAWILRWRRPGLVAVEEE